LLRASSPPQDSTAHCNNSTLPLAARDKTTPGVHTPTAHYGW
jgi:hypothetical protein